MARGKGKGARKALKAVSTPVTMRKRGAIRELSLAGVANCIIDKALEVGHVQVRSRWVMVSHHTTIVS